MKLFNPNKPFGFVHVELSEKCNAECPMCMRNDLVKKGKIDKNEMSLEQFTQIFTPIIGRIEEFWLSGNYSDPMTNTQIFEICEWIFQNNEKTNIRINTNASLRSKSYWSKLGKLFKKYENKHRKMSGIVASIDGLSDTNSIYRVNCIFEKAIENCKAFIDAGGNAMWKFIVFKHNEHQIEEAKKYSQEIGFKMFSIVASERFEHREQKIVFHEKKGKLNLIEKPNLKYKVDELLENEYDKINCHALKRNELFVDDKGRIMPCCWTMGRIAEHGNIGNDNYSKIVLKRYPNLMEELNALKNGIENVLTHNFWKELEMLWDVNQPSVCVSKCKKRMDDVSHYFAEGKELGWRKM